MKKGNKTPNANNRASSTPTPPPPSTQFRSPAQGYSKSILSAIKGIPYEHSSGGSRSSANSSHVQSPLSLPGNTSQHQEPGIRRAETTILKIKVGQFNEDEEEKLAEKDPKKETNLEKTPVSKSRRERRSVSCETALPNQRNATAIVGECKATQQKTNSVNMIDLMATGRQPPPMLASPLAGCSIASSQMGSTHSIHSSTASTTVASNRKFHRSPSAASSYCSKEGKSTTESQEALVPKIRITIFAKALDACANGKQKVLHGLIAEYPELVTYQYPHCLRLSCLHIAAKAGDLAIAQYLIKFGANVNAKDDTWATPMHFAAKAGQVEMIRLLRENGADSSIRDAHGHLYTAYLPTMPRIQMQSATLKPSKTSKYGDWGLDQDLISTGSTSSHSSTFAGSRFNHSFHSFRKPITRAVRDLLHRK